ncbi:30S ribosomal protein S20 [bacterium]|nr:30S ribosomal protein S20 [bacterium]
MAQHKSAIRQARRSLRRKAINRKNKSILRTEIKKLRTAIENKDRKKAEEQMPQTFSIIDKSIKKGTIHEITGNRYKSRLSRQIELINLAVPK